MATQTKKTKAAPTEEQIINGYLEYLLTEGKEPQSVFAFAKHQKFEESDFYAHFNSFNALEKGIWTNYIASTIEAIKADENYAAFTVREKLLSFFYTYLEVIKNNRSYIIFRINALKKPGLPAWAEGMRSTYKDYILSLINEGVENNEVKLPPVINERIDEGFWIQLIYITRVWVNDESKGFQNTDAAIEKSVNLAFDLLGKGPIDSIIDFAKFAIKTRVV
jgi:hypothetical protein